MKWLTQHELAKNPATVQTLEEEGHDQPKKTAVDTEYPPRSNDETLDEDAHR
jgi:hypothetical protein